MDFKDQTREICQGGAARNIADHTRLCPGNDVLFRLSDRERDDAHARHDIESAPDRAGTVLDRRIQQQNIRLQRGAQRHRLGEIGAQPDDRYQRITFEDLRETLAQEAHPRHDRDA